MFKWLHFNNIHFPAILQFSNKDDLTNVICVMSGYISKYLPPLRMCREAIYFTLNFFFR